ncbi:MAG: class I SAM-dependent methyltransferase, partial [Desulfobacterales bacterium]|nr:class I SAM-dependent methyltransferase [Desulfobacterales bacterium]
LLWLKNRGYAAIGFERSPGLADQARAHAGCPVIEGDFAGFNFTDLTFDALLVSGALVHLQARQLADVLDNLLKALNNPGWVFLSLKAGQGQRTDQWGRTFHLWQKQDLERLLERRGLKILDFSRSVSAAGTGEPWLGYVLAYGR